MITLSHIVYGWAASKTLKPKHTKSEVPVIGAVIGSFAPDVVTYIFFIYYTVFVGSSQAYIWGSLYFNSLWTPFITLTHSFIILPFLVALGYAFKKQWLFWIASGSLFHSAIDFLFHNTDAYAPFWPLTGWKFFSPVSYWNPTYYGNIVGPIDTVLVFLLLFYLWRKYNSISIRGILVFIGSIYVVMNIIPNSIFH